MRYGLRVPGHDLIDTYENTRAAGFGKEVRRRILIGTYVLSAGYYDAYYLKAQKVRTLIKRDFDEAWNKVDVVLTPTTPSPAFAFGEKTGDPLAMYLEDIFTVTVNMAGLPGISVPAGLSSRRHAARPAAHRQAVRRGNAVPRRAGDRGCGRALHVPSVVDRKQLPRPQAGQEEAGRQVMDPKRPWECADMSAGARARSTASTPRWSISSPSASATSSAPGSSR